jgi:hypothetical protein
MAATIATMLFRAELWDRGDGRCGLCGKPLDPNRMQIDHILPRREAGRDAIENLRAVHPACNGRRRDSHPRSRPDISQPLAPLHLRLPPALLDELNALVDTTPGRPTLFKVVEEGLRAHVANAAHVANDRRIGALMVRYSLV